jgi:hypothetical protein
MAAYSVYKHGQIHPTPSLCRVATMLSVYNLFSSTVAWVPPRPSPPDLPSDHQVWRPYVPVSRQLYLPHLQHALQGILPTPRCQS